MSNDPPRGPREFQPPTEYQADALGPGALLIVHCTGWPRPYLEVLRLSNHTDRNALRALRKTSDPATFSYLALVPSDAGPKAVPYPPDCP